MPHLYSAQKKAGAFDAGQALGKEKKTLNGIGSRSLLVRASNLSGNRFPLLGPTL
jgi:hypothetical protein